MSTTDGTMFLGNINDDATTQATSPKAPNNNKKAAAATAATGAAAAGLGAAGMYAYSSMNEGEEEITAIIDPDDDLEGGYRDSETAAPAGEAADPAAAAAAHRTAAPAGPAASTPGETPTPAVTDSPGQTPTPAVTDTPGQTPAPAETVDPVPVQIEVVDDPDELADAVIAVEEVDPEDFDGEAPFSFTGVETVYDIDGNALTQATFVDIDGDAGVMVDLDGDGVFDVASYDELGQTYLMTEDGLTVADAQLDVENGYLAYDEETDPMITDDPTQDIIDTEDFA